MVLLGRTGGLLAADYSAELSANINEVCVAGIYLLNGFLIVAVNSFFFISGYFKIKFKNFISLYLQVAFYKLLLELIELAVVEEFSLMELAKAFVKGAMAFSGYWFMTAYFGLYLLSPFLNRLRKLEI